MEMQSPKILFYKDENIKIELEYHFSFILMHCDILIWKPSVLKYAYSLFSKLLALADKMDKKLLTITPNPKFAKLFGGKTIDRFILNSIEYEVIIWE